MAFSVSLEVRSLPRLDRPAIDYALAGTDYGHLVMAGAQHLSEGDCVFHLSGFGRAPWPLEIGYDLSTFVERLP